MPNFFLVCLSLRYKTNDSMAKIELVVFDMAGTTVTDRKEVETCFAEACKNSRLIVSDERILALQGYSKIEVFRLLWDEKIGSDHPEYVENVFTSYDLFCEILEEHYYKSPVIPTLGCLEVFEYLNTEGIKIGLTTGFYRKVADIILEKLGWLKGLDENYLSISGEQSIIDCSVTSDMVEKGRPAPYMIQKVMKQLGVEDPKKVINIGDTPSDLLSGINAGCLKSYGLSNGTHTLEQLSFTENDGILSNLSELITEIKSLNN